MNKKKCVDLRLHFYKGLRILYIRGVDQPCKAESVCDVHVCCTVELVLLLQSIAVPPLKFSFFLPFFLSFPSC